MRSDMRSIEVLIFGATALALYACRRSSAGSSADTTGTASGEVSSVPRRAFTGDPQQAQRGRLLFLQNNCYGCHGGLAGGAMGPSLRDTVWKYGGSDEQIYASIHDGRPLGMPTWGGMLSDPQIHDLIAYIHSLRTNAEPTFFFWAQEGQPSNP